MSINWWLLLTSVIVIHSYEAEDTIQVELFEDRSHEGDSVVVNVTGCTDIQPVKNRLGPIESINTKGNCVNFYDSNNCTGNFVSLKPGNPVHDILAEWDRFNIRVKSISKCHEDCHETNIETMKNIVIARVYKGRELTGKSGLVYLTPGTCVVMPPEVGNTVMSFTDTPDACIELHEFPDCSGTSRDFPVGSPRRNDLKHWGDWFEPRSVQSISFCGYRCNLTEIGDQLAHTATQSNAPVESTAENNADIVKDFLASEVNMETHQSSCTYLIWILILVPLISVLTTLLTLFVVRLIIKRRCQGSEFSILFMKSSD